MYIIYKRINDNKIRLEKRKIKKQERMKMLKKK